MRIKLLLALIIMVLLSACSSTEKLLDDSMFKVRFEIPPSIKAGQTFEANAFITNESNKSWDISHGVDLFTFAIKDENGQLVNQKDTVLVIALGIASTILPDKPYSYVDPNSDRFRMLTLSEPGHYSITAKAKFRIKDNDDTYKDMIVTSEPKEIVIE
ncbi:hypothetical protein H8B09_29890 [Paenibacillus sp. PR3]|uniref:Lipoprotein n=1 Tax=Paenibacillus terricola TaxID=2763503 RepID=A0ABR8N648_9BACL|nr:hypothetical protein [Paenibacillus terricola]MBD3922957.1 hypothetical protein [Paenibacillus terricola]